MLGSALTILSLSMHDLSWSVHLVQELTNPRVLIALQTAQLFFVVARFESKSIHFEKWY